MKKLRDQVVYQNRGEHFSYNAFPSAVITPGGRMLVAFRQARDFSSQYGETVHLDPKAYGALLTSDDHGASWTLQPAPIADHYLYGIQDPCLTRLRDGTLFGSYFLWKLFADNGEPQENSAYGQWAAKLIGVRTRRSRDEGATWDEPTPLSPRPLALRGHPVELEDGTLLIAAYREGALHLFASGDRGQSWEARARIEQPGYCLQEPNLYLAPSGKIVAFIRSVPHTEETLTEAENAQWPSGTPLWQRGRLLTTESTDHGCHWSPLCSRPVFSSSPCHLLPLSSGRLLLTYGHRKPPYGIRARLLDAECGTWGEEIILRDDGPGFDMGYTSAVQTRDGTVWVFYYWHDLGGDGHRHIAATLCREAAAEGEVAP